MWDRGHVNEKCGTSTCIYCDMVYKVICIYGYLVCEYTYMFTYKVRKYKLQVSAGVEIKECGGNIARD